MIAEVRLGRAFLEEHPLRAAMSLEQMHVPEAAAVLAAVPARTAAVVLRDLNVPFAADCLVQLTATESSECAAAIVDALSIDEAAGIVRTMDAEARAQLLAVLGDTVRDAMERVLPYADGTAGSVMDPSVFRLPDDVLVADARVRLGRASRELLYYVYLVDREQQLVGVMDIPELMAARARDPVSAAMHRSVQRINVFTPVSLVREHSGWHSYHALPVVDDNDRLLGAIRYQTLRRLEREAVAYGPEPARLTAGALAELFQLGTTGFVAGIAASTGGMREAGVMPPSDPGVDNAD